MNEIVLIEEILQQYEAERADEKILINEMAQRAKTAKLSDDATDELIEEMKALADKLAARHKYYLSEIEKCNFTMRCGNAKKLGEFKAHLEGIKNILLIVSSNHPEVFTDRIDDLVDRKIKMLWPDFDTLLDKKLAQQWAIEKSSYLGELLSFQEQLSGFILLELEAAKQAGGGNGEIPPHPLKARREKVLEMVKSGDYFEKDIAQSIGESVDVVKQDKLWLRKRRFLP